MPNTASGYYFADGSTPMSAEDISAAEATAAETVFTGFQGDNYFFRQTVYFTATGTFAKADYPWLRAARVYLVGGGGGGGGSQNASSGNHSVGGGGGGGGYAEAFILASAIGASKTVTVGAQGSTSYKGDGGSGGSSSFGALVSATGGGGGKVKPNSVFHWYIGGTTGGIGTAGDLLIRGGPGGIGGGYGALGSGGPGGDSRLGGGAPANGGGAGGGDYTGATADGYGGGGGGAQTNSSGTGASGGGGGQGVVVVEMFA